MEDIAVKVERLSKLYKLYDNPIDRLKESLSLSKKIYFKEHYALKNISFEVKKGDAVGILGKNGSGKSTLLKILTGVLNETEGSKVVNGKISAILELGAGFNPEYTGIENVYLNGTMMGYTREEMDQRIPRIIDFADIGEFINQPVKTYSSGMFARLAFAVAINVEPDILIVDEALAVGDTRFQMKCIEKMKSLKESNTTILFVSHAIEQVKRFCNEAIWIDGGEIKQTGPASEVCDIYESFMRNGEAKQEIEMEEKQAEHIQEEEAEIIRPNADILASITAVELSKDKLKTFDSLEVNVTYEVYEERVDGFLLGVAIYTPDRNYIFGPNTHLDKISVPNIMGRHKVKYKIPKITLLGGIYNIDVGIFNNEGIVNLDYKSDIKSFTITNEYFTEGQVYIEHNWEVIK